MNRRLRFEIDQLLALALGAFFLGTGIAKLVNADFIVDTFGGWEYPLWILAALGVVEIGAAVLTVIPATRLLGALALAALMVGALVYHLARGEFDRLPLPALAFLVTAALTACELTARAERAEPGAVGPVRAER